MSLKPKEVVVRALDEDHGMFSIDCEDPQTQCETYGELRKRLDQEGCLVTDAMVLVDEDGNRLDEDQDTPIDFNRKDISLQYLKFTITVFHRGERVDLTIPVDSTVRKLKQAFANSRITKAPSQLTFNGEALHDDELLEDKEIGDGDTVVGLIKVIVIDRQIDREQALELYPHFRVDEVKKMYMEQQKRLARKDSKMSFEGQTLNDDEKTLYELEIEHESTIEYVSPEFEVKIVETDRDMKVVEEHVITARDDMTIIQLQEAYVQQTGAEPLEPDVDKMYYEKNEILRDRLLVDYMIRDLDKIEVMREDITQVHHKYLCADCGSEVRLKQEDVVRCRECGFRIVFKMRTRRPGQYLAR